MRVVFLCTAALMMSACGSEKSEARADTETSSPKSGASALTTTPISFADATGETSELMEVGPCPFVSDEIIKASVRSTFEIKRMQVSNTECRWAYNAGFSISVTIENLSTARPVSERQYNIGVDTTSSPQDGPGQNAFVLNDTAWDRPIPFAYSFEKDAKLVFMAYTGFKTNAETMRPAADEIAARMSSAPSIEPQQRHVTEPFKPCETWTEQDLKTVFGAGDSTTIGPGASTMHTCKWTLLEDGVSGQRTAALNIYKPKPGEKAEYEYDSYQPYVENGEKHYLRRSDSEFGMYVHVITPRPEGHVYVTVSDPNADPTSTAKSLQNNLLSRMVP